MPRVPQGPALFQDDKYAYFNKTFYAPIKRLGFPGDSDCKESACNVGDVGSIPGSGRSPGEENGNLLLYSCLENPRDRGAWQATIHGVAKESDMT